MQDIILVVLVLVWIGACICCFRASPGTFRRAGIGAMGVLVGTLVIWLGGNSVLGKFGLAQLGWYMFPGCDDLGLPGDSHMCCGLYV